MRVLSVGRWILPIFSRQECVGHLGNHVAWDEEHGNVVAKLYDKKDARAIEEKAASILNCGGTR